MIVFSATFPDAPARTACTGTSIDRAPVVFSEFGAVHGSIHVSGIANVVLVDSHTFVKLPLPIA